MYSLGRDGVAAEGDERRKLSAPGKCQVSCRAECPLSCMNQLSYLSGGGEDKQSCRSKEFSNSENNRDRATTNASRAMDCSHPLFWKHKAFSGLLFSLFCQRHEYQKVFFHKKNNRAHVMNGRSWRDRRMWRGLWGAPVCGFCQGRIKTHRMSS